MRGGGPRLERRPQDALTRIVLDRPIRAPLFTRLPPWATTAIVLVVVLAAYANSFPGPFVFDDLPAIAANATIKPGTSIASWLQPPTHSTVAGRPFLNFSFALDQLISGDGVWSYHAINLLIHLAAGACLFGIVRRTLNHIPSIRPTDPSTVAAVAAALWLLHPLQTESVTYVVQRAESLAGLLYLGALYAFVRGNETGAAKFWPIAAVLLAGLGMATKEHVVTLPILILCYDRIFLSPSVVVALRRNAATYLGLLGTWAVLGSLMALNPNRGGSAGFGTSVAPLAYAMTQVYAVVHYLSLAIAPRSLVFDYGRDLVPIDVGWAMHGLIYLMLLVGTIRAVVLWPRLGFLGLAFFLLLAPTSTFVPVASQTIAEHRMYLPLAAVLTSAAFIATRAIGHRSIPIACAVVLPLMTLTLHRNQTYQSPEALWSDTAAKQPKNARAHDWLGEIALSRHHFDRAVAEFRLAAAGAPHEAKYRNNYGAALASVGQYAEAVTEFDAAVTLDHDFRDAVHNLAEAETKLAVALIQHARIADAVPHLRRASQLEPSDPARAQNLQLTLEQLAPR